MKNGGDVRMTQASSRSGFPYKAPAHGFVLQISRVDDLQRHWTLQIDINCLVSDSHRAPAQLHRSAVLTTYEFIVLESIFRWIGLRRHTQSLTAKFDRVAKSFAQHANGTELPRATCGQRRFALRTGANFSRLPWFISELGIIPRILHIGSHVTENCIVIL